MSFFELTLLAGLGLGGVVASQFYRLWDSGSFFAVGVIYLLCSALILPVRSERRRVTVVSPFAGPALASL